MSVQWNRKPATFVMLIALTTIVTTFSAEAFSQCGTSPRQNANTINPETRAKLLGKMRSQMQGSEASPRSDETIVGLWDVKYLIDGQLYDEVFDQFHADGNEVAIDIVPPVTGNVCLGIWKRRAGRSFAVKHPFWIFDPVTNTVLIGRGLITMDIRLLRGANRFVGTFTITFRDLDDQPIPGFSDASGDIVGDRITID